MKIPGLSAEQLEKVRAILFSADPASEFNFFCFGSRVDGSYRLDSDLDLLLQSASGGKNPAAILSGLRQAFEESNLPFKVDLLDEAALSKDFKRKIGKNIIKIR